MHLDMYKLGANPIPLLRTTLAEICSMATFQLHVLPVVVLVLLLLLGSPAAAGKTGQLAVFWGRDKDEGSLREACDTGVYTTVIISFFSVFGHGRYWTDLSGHQLYGVGADVKHCQRDKNVTVLLSIGGDGDGYSLPTVRSARDVAEHLWHAYLGGGRRKGVFRPFGDAVLNGVDLYIDHGGSAHYDELARRLAAYNDRHGEKASAAVLLTATVRCMDGQETSADAALGTGLLGRIHVRYYNDTMCSFNAEERRPFYGSWVGWAQRYPKARLYVGLPAARDAATDGWVDPETLFSRALPLVQDTPGYGGVMLWDRYFDRRDRYGVRIKHMV
jgi:chitinase